MKTEKKNRLEKAGWRVGSTQEFLGLTDAEAAITDVRVALARALKSRRLKRHVSQATVAQLVGSSQARVARMEAGDPSVSLDLLLRTLLTFGTSPAEIGRVIAGAAA